MYFVLLSAVVYRYHNLESNLIANCLSSFFLQANASTSPVSLLVDEIAVFLFEHMVTTILQTSAGAISATLSPADAINGRSEGKKVNGSTSRMASRRASNQR